MRPLRVRRSINSPPSLGQRTPIFSNHGSVCRQVGKSEQPMNFPYRP
jgi:hypothetical protein